MRRHLWAPLAVAALLASAGAALAAAWPDLGRDLERAKAGAKDVALIVSIEDYAHVSDVPGAGANARDWLAWFGARGTPARLIQDAQAQHRWTREGAPAAGTILAEVEAAATRARKKGGRLWFVFIGHGAPSKDNKGLILPADVRQSAASIQANGVAIEAELLPRVGEQAVVVIDACFSGKDAAGGSLAEAGLQPLVPVSLAPTGAAKGVVVFTAAASDQFAGPLPGASRGRPAFSYLLLGALQGWGDVDGDKRVSAREAVNYVDRALYQLVTGRKQTPTLIAADGGTTLSSGWRPAPDLTGFVAPAPAALTPGGADFAAELARLEAARKQREAAEAQERAQAEAVRRALRVQIDEAWALTLRTANGGGAEGCEAVKLFSSRFDRPENHRRAEATALRERLCGAPVKPEAAVAVVAEGGSRLTGFARPGGRFRVGVWHIQFRDRANDFYIWRAGGPTPILEFIGDSNGWFRLGLGGKPQTVYTDGRRRDARMYDSVWEKKTRAERLGKSASAVVAGQRGKATRVQVTRRAIEVTLTDGGVMTFERDAAKVRFKNKRGKRFTIYPAPKEAQDSGSGSSGGSY